MNGPGGVTERTLPNGTIRGLNRRVPVGHVPGGARTRPGEIRNVDDCTRGGVLVGPDTATSGSSAALTVAAANRSVDLHQQVKRAQQQHWRVESVASGGGAGGSVETGSVDNVVLPESLEATLPVAAAARGSTTSVDGWRGIVSCRGIGEEGGDDDRSGKVRSGVRMLPSLKSRGLVNVSQADVGLDEDFGQSGGGGVCFVKNDVVIGYDTEAVAHQFGTSHTPPAETQVREGLLYEAASS